MKPQSKYAIWLTLLLTVALSWISSCSLLQQRRRTPDCKALFEQIEQGWVRDPETGLYQLTAKALAGNRFGSFHDDECLIGLAPNDVERLFGKPDTMLDGRMDYYMDKPCLDKNQITANDCYRMTIRFDEEGGLKMILFTSSHTEIDYIDPRVAPGNGK